MGGNRIYTHALDRDSMTIAPESRIAITVHWQGKRLDPERSSISFNLDDLFVVQDNRLHRALACDRDPAERITGVTQFSRTLPFDQLHGSLLPYPVGTGDLGKLTGREFDRDNFQKIHRFIYLGEKDQNDSVPYRDGFGKTASDLVFSLIGKTPLERHRFVESILGTRGYQNTEFVYYPEIGHQMTKQTRQDMFDFLENHQK